MEITVFKTFGLTSFKTRDFKDLACLADRIDIMQA